MPYSMGVENGELLSSAWLVVVQVNDGVVGLAPWGKEVTPGALAAARQGRVSSPGPRRHEILPPGGLGGGPAMVQFAPFSTA